MEHFRSEMNRLDEHNPATDCRMRDMEVVRETRRGLCIGWTYKCKMCNLEEIVWSQPQNKKAMSINMAATAGTVLTGGGHAQLAQQLALMNMPSMDHKTFAKCEQDLFRGWQAAALDLMKKAVEEEIEHARRLGHVDENGIPLLTVTVDGSWPKRSSRTNYSSLSGMVRGTTVLVCAHSHFLTSKLGEKLVSYKENCATVYEQILCCNTVAQFSL
jgi:hypothetical protein